MIVIKYGGNALPDTDSNDPVLEAIGDAFLDGEQIVLVHGGGPQIDKALKEKGIGSEKVAGYRVTDLQVFEVCLLYTSPSPRDRTRSRMPSSA